MRKIKLPGIQDESKFYGIDLLSFYHFTLKDIIFGMLKAAVDPCKYI